MEDSVNHLTLADYTVYREPVFPLFANNVSFTHFWEKNSHDSSITDCGLYCLVVLALAIIGDHSG